MTLLILRPEPGATATAERARAIGLKAVVAPLFAIAPVAWEPPAADRFDALLLTSANAVRHGAAGLAALAALPVAAVGEATAAAAGAAGLDVQWLGHHGVEAVLATMPPLARLLHLAGHDRIEPSSGHLIERVTVYRAVAQDVTLPPLDGMVVALHSRRAARRLALLVPIGQRGGARIVAISGATASAAGAGWRQVEIASQPDDESVVALAARLCHIADQ